jgi:citrate synthase
MALQLQLYDLVAKVLKINKSRVTSQLSYQSIAEWDSLTHIDLMITLEDFFQIPISNKEVSKLTSVFEIEQYIQNTKLVTDNSANNTPISISDTNHKSPHETVNRGLNGVVFDHTTISKVDSNASSLLYRGLNVSMLMDKHTFEEVAHLLVMGHLPSQPELDSWNSKWKRLRCLREEEMDLIGKLKNLEPIDFIVNFIPLSEQLHRSPIRYYRKPDIMEQQESGIRILAKVPSALALHQRFRSGLPASNMETDLSHAGHFLYLLNGFLPSKETESTLDKDFILHAEHGSNASAFAARVVASTQSDMANALTAAVCTFAGRLHGGAIQDVLKMLDCLTTPGQVKEFVKKRMSEGLGVPGFGHRVYRAEDPRSQMIKKTIETLASKSNLNVNWEVILAVQNEMQKYRKKGMELNVDFYTAVLYRLIGIPTDMAITTFLMARLSGLIAHVCEQYEANILIPPVLKYAGKTYE